MSLALRSTDPISGQLRAMTNAVPERFPLPRGGRVRVIGIMPDVPVFKERGIKAFVMDNAVGIVAPVGTPAALRSRLAQEVTRILQSPETRKRLEQRDFGTMGGTSEAFGNRSRAEAVRFGAAVKASGATAY